MMDCKRALQEAGGDEEQAIDVLRQWGAAKSAKRTGREMREGAVLIEFGDGAVAMVAVSSETDFVARNQAFKEFSSRLAQQTAAADLADGEIFSGESLLLQPAFARLKEELEGLTAKFGENLEVQKAVRYEVGEGTVGSYLHFGSRIGALVELQGTESEDVADLARELAMHVAATNPTAVSPNDIPEEEQRRERAVLAEQAKLEGKPERIVDKIVEGRMRKYFEENALLIQGFVKDPDTKISELLASRDPELRVRRFVRFEIGGQ
jgi:elongation factor Ts